MISILFNGWYGACGKFDFVSFFQIQSYLNSSTFDILNIDENGSLPNSMIGI